jgi:CubicO group peptidase (beta-lactamase class C family)
MWRRGLAGLLTTVMACSDIAAASSPKDPVGCVEPGLAPFDAEMTRLMDKWQLPGGGLAVSHNGRVLLVRGYGLADKSTGARVTPATKFRLGSVSKPITAVAILKLIEEGRLRLDDKVLPLLGDLAPPAEAIRDPRMHAITVRHLLQHTGGFDRGVSGDALFMPYAGAALARQNAKPPPTCRIVLRDALERQLDFDPGSRFAYSNLGYCILGRIIERVAGIAYVEFVRSRVLEPAGASGLMLGRTLEAARDEATYYDFPGAPKVTAMPGVAKGVVERPYGYAAIEEMDAYGGWIGAPIEVLRFFLAIDGQRAPPLLSNTSFQVMLSRPEMPELKARSPSFYGLGVEIRILDDGRRNWWHGGQQPGFHAFVLRTAGGQSWASAFNSLPADRSGFWRDLDTSLWAAARQVASWAASSSSCAAHDRN